MPAATVIDQLIVKLGLDPTDFDKGRKQQAAGVLQLEKDVKRSTGEMSKGIVAFTGKILGIATAAAVVKKVVGYTSELSTSIRRLGIDSRNFGIAASEMRNFQNIGEMMGGSIEDVTKTIGGLTKAVYDLAYNGQISDSLITLGRLGVQFQTTTGDARDFRDIILDTEKAIQQRLRNGSISRVNAAQMLAQAGIDPGLAQAILQGTVGAQLAKQEGRRQVSGEVVAAATQWEESATSRDQEIAAAALRGLPAAAAVGTKANELIEGGARYASEATATSAIKDFTSALDYSADKVKESLGSMADSLENFGARFLAQSYAKGRGVYESTIQSAAAKYGVNPEMLAGVLDTESKFDPAARNAKSGAMGIAQLNPKYFPRAGISPRDDINTAAQELRRLHDDFTKSGDADDSGAWYLALQAYNAGESRVRKSMAEGGKPLAQETLDYPGKVLDYASSAVPTPGAQAGGGPTSNSTSSSLSIGTVNVNTQATDADGIARDMAGATKRKFTAAQADVGMQ